MNSLPEDANVYDQVGSATESEQGQGDMNPNNLGPTDENQAEGMISNGFVSHLQSDESEMAALKNALKFTEPVFTLPEVQGQPLNKHDPDLKYLIDAFPILFPIGVADLHHDRPFPVTNKSSCSKAV